MLMEELGLSGYIFTFDALHCQRKTLETAKETGNEVIVQVKSNQKTLLQDCETVSETTVPDDIYQEPVTKTRNRIESRKVETFISPPLTDAEKWNLVDVVVKVTRYRQIFNTQSKSWQNSDETSLLYCYHPLERSGILPRNPQSLGNRKSKSLCSGCLFARRPLPHSYQPPHLCQIEKLCSQHLAQKSGCQCQL